MSSDPLPITTTPTGCVTDTSVMMDIMLAWDTLEYVTCCVPKNAIYYRIFVGFNVSFIGVWFIQMIAPSVIPSSLAMHVLMHAIIILLIILLCTTTHDLFFILLAILALTTFQNSIRNSLSTWTGWDSGGPGVIVLTIVIYILVCFVLYWMFESKAWKFLYQELFKDLFETWTINAKYILHVNNHTLCYFGTSDPDQNPFELGTRLLVLLFVVVVISIVTQGICCWKRCRKRRRLKKELTSPPPPRPKQSYKYFRVAYEDEDEDNNSEEDEDDG
jgi:hypothetical protein